MKAHPFSDREARLFPLAHTVLATLLFCAASVAFTWNTSDFKRFLKGQNDFVPRYSQGRLLGSPLMYDQRTTYEEQMRSTGFMVVGAYHDRQPWQAIVFRVLSLLPYKTAYWCWVSLNVLSFGLLVRYWLLKTGYAAWGCVYMPMLVCILIGQDDIMIALTFAGVLHLASQRRDAAAGALLALCSAKPQLFVLAPAAILLHRRWRLFWSAVVGIIALFAVGTAAARFFWPPDFLKILLDLHSGLYANREDRVSVFQFGVNWGSAIVAIAVGVISLACLRRMRSLEESLAVASIGGALTVPHVYLYSLAPLLVSLTALRLKQFGHYLRLILLTPIPYIIVLRGIPYSTVLSFLLFALMIFAAIEAQARTRLAELLSPHLTLADQLRRAGDGGQDNPRQSSRLQHSSRPFQA